MHPQILNDTIFYTLIGISIFGLAALGSAHQYLRTELGEWDRGISFLLLFLASSIVINISFKEQVGGNNFFVEGQHGATVADNSFTWIYVLSLCTNICLILALKHIRPDQHTRLGALLARINWNWVLGLYILFAVLSFTLTSQVNPDFRSFLDAYASSFSVLLFTGCTGVILWHRQGRGFAVLMVLSGLTLAVAQGYLFGKIYPDSSWKPFLPGSGLAPQQGVALYIVGRAGLIMSMLNLSQTWLKIRLEEQNAATKEVPGKNELRFNMLNNELSIQIKMKDWNEFSDISNIASKTVVRDMVQIAAATQLRKPIQHQVGNNFSRMRKNILTAINEQLPPDKQLSDTDLFGHKTKETIFKFDADAVELSTEVIDFYR